MRTEDSPHAPDQAADHAAGHPADHPAPIPFTEPWQYELGFPCDPRGPRIARITLRAVLAAHELTELSYRAELLACELATNSVRHTRGSATVRLHWLYPVLRVSVWDASPDLPKRYEPSAGVDAGGGVGAYAEGGRGLAIVELVADRWGGCAIGDGVNGPGGKTVWFELALAVGPVPPGPALPSALAA
ncbi:ATP-binding protein [Streptomyces sp. NPDC050610]|uniref:ATP-binding protein n=1 Tax=Streptomyces sp. NPDC050610 TaxID=3157097 RepID=UPI0034440B44